MALRYKKRGVNNKSNNIHSIIFIEDLITKELNLSSITIRYIYTKLITYYSVIYLSYIYAN